jgi:chromate transporter
MDEDVLWGLVRVFVPLSFLSIGGGPSILAEMEHQTVAVHGWLTQRDFVDLFAISRAAPGPGTLIVTLVGWKVAGWPGALVASLALYIPSSLVVLGATLLWRRYRAATWRQSIERGLAPIAIGLVFAGAYSILQATHGGAIAWITAAIAAAILAARQLHPLLLLGAVAAIYAVMAPLVAG